MVLRIVRLGSPRVADEGLRIGTVRRPPRGVPKAEFARQDWYDVWLPALAPSAATLRAWQAAPSDQAWPGFARRYRAEMARPEARQLIALLAALSQRDNLSVGCYCADARHCHRTLLGDLLVAAGAVRMG